MTNTVFFSWQSDTPNPIGRTFLRKVLVEVCAEITADASVEEAFRNGLRVDSDTEGVAGQPPIAETILKKIDAAAVFVADMTFTGKRNNGRPTPNANVLIEYGWALKSLGYGRVISVMNEAYGKASSQALPFDLAHLRWPIRYCLSKDATTQQKAEAKRRLATTLKAAIRACLESIPTPPALPTPSPPQPVFPKADTKDGPARFRNAGAEVGYYDGTRSEVFRLILQPGPAMWLRVMPVNPPNKQWLPRQIKAVALRSGTVGLLPLVNRSSLSWVRADDGWGVFSVSDQQGFTESMVFVFQTGEVWSVDTSLLARYGDKMPFIEREFADGLGMYARFLNALEVPPPYQWIAGLTGVKGRQLVGVPGDPWGTRFGHRGPLCLSETIQAEGIYTSGQSAVDALLPFYELIFEKCGEVRPTNIQKS